MALVLRTELNCKLNRILSMKASCMSKMKKSSFRVTRKGLRCIAPCIAFGLAQGKGAHYQLILGI